MSSSTHLRTRTATKAPSKLDSPWLQGSPTTLSLLGPSRPPLPGPANIELAYSSVVEELRLELMTRAPDRCDPQGGIASIHHLPSIVQLGFRVVPRQVMLIWRSTPGLKVTSGVVV